MLYSSAILGAEEHECLLEFPINLILFYIILTQRVPSLPDTADCKSLHLFYIIPFFNANWKNGIFSSHRCKPYNRSQCNLKLYVLGRSYNTDVGSRKYNSSYNKPPTGYHVYPG